MGSSAAGEDRRVRRTKASLRAAIVALSLEKGFHAVTGDDIAERADVTRASFYKHYDNKEHLLADAVDDFADEVLDTFGPLSQAPPGRSRVVTLIECARQRRDLVCLVLRGEGNGVALRRFHQVIEQIISNDIATGRISIIDPTLGADLMVKLRAAQVVAGVAYALDVDDDADDVARAVVAAIDLGWQRHQRGRDPRPETTPTNSSEQETYAHSFHD